jgi:sugar lactone lactonase YvrE
MKSTHALFISAITGSNLLACAANVSVTGTADADGGHAAVGPTGVDGGQAAVDAGQGSTGATSDAGSASDDAATPAPVIGTITFLPGVNVSTLAGSATGGSQDGSGAAAQFDNPTGIAVDPTGNLLITDYDSGRVRLVTAAGVVTSLTGANPSFVNPFAVVVATDGTYYVETDANNSGVKDTMTGTIWRLPVPLAGAVATPVVVGQGFGRPRGLAPNTAGTLFVADRTQVIVQTLAVASDTTTLVAGEVATPGFANGTGASAMFDGPIGVAALPNGAGWLVADSVNNRIRQVTPAGVVTTFAGSGTLGINDGPAAGAYFNTPRAVAVDAAGNAYVSDGGNHRIRRIGTDGTVVTVAGDGTMSFQDGTGSAAEFYGQEGIAVTSDGKTVYVADGNGGDGSAHNRVRAIAMP